MRSNDDLTEYIFRGQNEIQSPETRLYRAIILQAVIDLRLDENNPDNARTKHEALKWFEKGGDDFEMICALADVDPNYIKERVRDAGLRGYRRHHIGKRYQLKTKEKKDDK